jgi:hypothetical protein
MTQAIDLVIQKRGPDGRWYLIPAGAPQFLLIDDFGI